MIKNTQRLNFNYNNLILEREVIDKDFNDNYQLLQECTDEIAKENQHIKNRRELFELATKMSPKTLILNNNKAFLANTGTSKLLFISNIIFHDEHEFIDTIINEFSVDIDKVHQLKDALNTLNKNDQDYLNGTIGALIDKYIPNYILIAEHFGMKDNPDFILVKLLEILYLKPEKLKSKNK